MIHLSRYVVQQLMRETVHSHIYRGISKSDKRPVAIKVAREATREAHAAAQQELEIVRKLDGLLVVRGIEIDYFEERPALVMELFPGVGLDQWLDGKPLDLGRFLRIAIGIAGALAGIHDRGIIHRDLKPSNILVHPETLSVCIADFGVAASLDGAMSLQAAAMVGSLAYLSPEQTGRMNRRVDSRSDLYSLGVTFYELATGNLPFERGSPLELVHAHLALTPRSPSERNPEVPLAVSAVIAKLLAKAPDARYQSAHGVEADLRELAGQLVAGQSLGGFALGQKDRARTFLLPTKLYGRASELAVLERCLGRCLAQDGVVELLAVGGASGSGKTALFAEAEHRLALQRGYFIKGKFDRLARNVPFSAINQALSALVEQLLAKSDAELDAIRGDILRRLAGLGQVLIEIAPVLEKVIGPQPPAPLIGLPESQARIGDVFWRFIGALATRERPLVMVLDDLQWADSGSLLLIDALIEEGRYHRRKVSLLVLAAYRDSEMPDSHAFRQLLDRMGGTGEPGKLTTVHELTLRPLEVDHVAQLLADTLRMPLGQVGELAATVFAKTSGNAFFVHQFLQHAYRLGLFVYADDGWQWDLAEIQTAGIPDDAADLMAEKIRSLVPGVQRVLVDSSVIGDELDVPTLFAVTEVPCEDALHAIHALIGEGLLVRSGEGYRFAHDKIREAALGLCPPDHAPRVHVSVGRHRLQSLRDDDRGGGPIFATTDHLNHGRHLLSDEEKLELAELNLRSGKQALAVGAVSTAKPYLEVGLELLAGDEHWDSHFQMMFELTLEHAYARFYGGEHADAIAAYQALLERDLSLFNRVKVYLRLNGARVSLSDYATATEEGLKALAEFGIKLPRPVSPMYRLVALLKAMWKIGREPEKLLALPPSTDEIARTRNQLVCALGLPFYFVDAKLSGVLTMTAVPMMIDDGVDDSSPMELISYALVLHVALNRPVLARRFANVAGELHQRLGSPQNTAFLMFTRYQLVEPWHVPYRESLEQFRIAIEKALDVGDYQNFVICHVCRMSCAVTEGIHLGRVDRIGQDAFEGCSRAGLGREHEVIAALRKIAAQLRDAPATDERNDWFADLPLSRLEYHLVAAAQLLLLLVRGDYDAAYELADKSYPVIFTEATAVVLVWLVCIALGVGAANRLRKGGGDHRRYRKQLDETIKRLRGWAAHNPAFFIHKALWLEAERAWARGKTGEASAIFLEAREAALAADYAHLAAAIDLRRGALALEIGRPHEAASCFRTALAAYRAWGARALVVELEQRYAEHAVAPPADYSTYEPASPDSLGTTGMSSPHHLDFGGLVTASQAIAQEVTLASVLEQVMATTMALAGANLGVLLLEKHGALTVEIRQRAGGKLERLATPFDAADDLPRSIVRYVHHSGEAVVLGDAATSGGYMTDPWVKARGAKSILCAPIVKQARRVGVLFLHNELVSNAFTDRLLGTLQMLATQAAISIDNAILYDELSTLNRELEVRVEERTRALREAQEQLVASARKAGMADVAVEVLHSVRTALNGVNVSAQLVQSRLAESKLKTFRRVATMLEEHRDHLGEFLTRDERGSQVAAMISALAEAMTSEQDSMQQELARLRVGIGSVGAVVRELEAAAEDKGIAVLEAPQVLLGAATSALGERSAREQISIVIDDQPLSGARVDKHKGLDILVGLLSNAADSLSSAGGQRQIRVSVRSTPDTVVFQISDNGIGIPRENLHRIFGGGFTTKPDRRGANLYRFANLAATIGGNLIAESDGIGRGATFTLILPNRGLIRSAMTLPPRSSEPPPEAA